LFNPIFNHLILLNYVVKIVF